jgi:uncharacterized protein involved in outer membrane biogenesis
MKKVLWWSTVVLVAALVLTVVARNVIARKSVELGVTRATGFPLTIGTVKVGLWDDQLTVNDLKLMNPPDFEERLFVDMPVFNLDFQLSSFLRGVPHIREMKIDLKQVVVVTNTKGDSNLKRLQGLGGSSTTNTNANSGRSSKFQLDVVHIHFGTVTTKDYSSGTLIERSTPLNVDVTFQNITDTTDVTRLVLMTIMSRLPDVGLRMDDLQSGLGTVNGGAKSAVKSATDRAKGLYDRLKPAKATP